MNFELWGMNFDKYFYYLDNHFFKHSKVHVLKFNWSTIKSFLKYLCLSLHIFSKVSNIWHFHIVSKVDVSALFFIYHSNKKNVLKLTFFLIDLIYQCSKHIHYMWIRTSFNYKISTVLFWILWYTYPISRNDNK